MFLFIYLFIHCYFLILYYYFVVTDYRAIKESLSSSSSLYLKYHYYDGFKNWIHWKSDPFQQQTTETATPQKSHLQPFLRPTCKPRGLTPAIWWLWPESWGLQNYGKLNRDKITRSVSPPVCTVLYPIWWLWPKSWGLQNYGKLNRDKITQSVSPPVSTVLYPNGWLMF